MKSLFIAASLSMASAFVTISQSPTTLTHLRFGIKKVLFHNVNNPGDMNQDVNWREDNNNESEEIEAARRRLEFLIKDETENDSYLERSSTLLSSIGRERKELEIALLQALEDSDEAQADLWSLWYSERGPQAHAQLRRIEETMFTDPASWSDAEANLQDMISQYGVQFSEPCNRLATLYYMQGRFIESRKLCHLVLEHKPWHFGALSGIVNVCAGMKDIDGARKWAARRLPPIVPSGTTDNHRRKEWVRRAVKDARSALLEEEERIRHAFGKRQSYEQRYEVQAPLEEDSWQ